MKMITAIVNKKDAGEVGSGHTLIVLYEIVPGDATEHASLKYQDAVEEDDLLTFRIRWKNPGEEESKLSEYEITENLSEEKTENYLLASGAAEFALLLKNSEFKGDASFDSVTESARIVANGDDPFGIKAEFLHLAKLSELLYTENSEEALGYPPYED